MERKELKEIFERLEELSDEIASLLELLNNICRPESVDENCQYLHIIVTIILQKFSQLDIIRTEANIACLD